MPRPPHLPEFAKPPVDEVVLGIQFDQPPNFSPVYSRDVWELFQPDFPTVQEQPVLQTQFETFGGIASTPSIQFQFGNPIGSRLFFISVKSDQIIQFQPDRFLMNWRSNQNSSPYPRYDRLATQFKDNADKLFRHFDASFGHIPSVNQAEVSYINVVPVDDFSESPNWISLFKQWQLSIEGLNLNLSEVVFGEENRPIGRLLIAIDAAFSLDGNRKALRLSLTVRGKPEDKSIDSAMGFMEMARQKIVSTFKQVTTDAAHETWEIVR